VQVGRGRGAQRVFELGLGGPKLLRIGQAVDRSQHTCSKEQRDRLLHAEPQRSLEEVSHAQADPVPDDRHLHEVATAVAGQPAVAEGVEVAEDLLARPAEALDELVDTRAATLEQPRHHQQDAFESP
jgi:hypothetical protein